MEEKSESSEQSINNPKENNSRRTFLKVAAVAAGGTALAATIAGVVRVPFLSTAESATTEPLVAAAPATLKKLTPYIDPLVIPPALVPNTTLYPGTDYYEVSLAEGTTHKFHTSLPATTTLSYFATPPAPGFHYLGPTIVANKGTPVKVKVTNNLPLGLHLIDGAMDYTIMGNTDPSKIPPFTAAARWTDEHRVCVHLHGGKVKTESDGGPRDWFSPVGSTQANPYPEAVDPGLTGSHTYDYPNDQPAAMLWYHDHAWGITRFNPFLGLAGAYIVRDPGENALIASGAIPSGAYEVPIALQDKLLDLATGAWIYPITATPGTHPIWIPEYFGNTPIVNGKAYPFLNVEPRRYRLRFINGSNARFYNIWFQGPSAGNLPIWVIGSEQGFLPAPQMVNSLILAPGERFDTIVDFTGLKLDATLTLKNNAKAPYPGGRGGEITEIMQFKAVALKGADTTSLPGSLTLPPIDPPLTPPLTPWREIVLQEIMDPLTGQPLEILLDGQKFIDSAPPNPPLITETDGAVNVWQFINTTPDAHPMHMHLVKFKIVDRQKFDSKAFLTAWNAWNVGNRIGTRPSVSAFLIGAPTLPEPEETGWKDTAKSYPGEVLRIIAKFDLPAGVTSGTYRYVCHCHILEHEENDMMFYFGVNKP